MASRKKIRQEKAKDEAPADPNITIGGAAPNDPAAPAVTVEQYVGQSQVVGKAGFAAYARAHLPKRMTREQWVEAEAAHKLRPVR